MTDASQSTQQEAGRLIAQMLAPMVAPFVELIAAGVRAELRSSLKQAATALPELLTKREAATELRCTPKTVDSYIARGLLTPIRRMHGRKARVLVSSEQVAKMLGGQT
jgi:DNA-directed RNA polymerase specialized sigma24 family protein